MFEIIPAFTPSECGLMLETLQKTSHWKDGVTTAAGMAGYVKKNSQIFKDGLDEIVADAIGRQFEIIRPRFVRYQVGDMYGRHYDTLKEKPSHSFSIPLNFDFEGGELIVYSKTSTDKLYAHKLSVGQMHYYPSCYEHEVTPVTMGTRFAIVGWLL